MYTEARSRLFFGFLDRQTLQSQWMNGTPLDVPQPKMVT